MESDLAGTLWQVHRSIGTILWNCVKNGLLGGIAGELPFNGLIFVLSEDEFGNLYVLTAYGLFWIPYQNMKKAASRL